MATVSRVIVIRNEQGLHARPAEMFARRAMQFKARIELVHEGRRIEAKSIINLLTLGATQGTQLVLEADGEDADQACEALSRLVDDGFDGEVNDQQAAGSTPGE
jgi:phosphocarrier protein HPr